MATGTTNTTALVNTYQSYFQKQLLKHAIEQLQLHEFATKAELPRKQGAKQVDFFRRVRSDKANVQTLSEGTPISTFTKVTMEKVGVSLTQLGEAVKITDITTYTELFNALKQGISLMGEDAALKCDDVILNAIIAGTTVERYARNIADFSTLGSTAAASATLIASDLLDGMTNLVINRAPKFNGAYVAIVPPQVARDLMRDEDWLEASKYSAVTQLFKGEVGSLYGVRVVISTNVWTEDGTKGTRDDAGGIYSSIITGQGGFGCVNLAGDRPSSPKIMIADKPDKSDPLNQFMTAGWKAFYASLVLNTTWTIVVRSKTLYA